MSSVSLRRPLSFVAQSDQAKRYVVVIAWIAILLGIVFRLTQLPVRTVYFDEAYTFMRVSGQTEGAMWKALYDGQPRTARELQRGNATVDEHSSPKLLVSSLIKEDSQHPPLFYLAELAIVKLCGGALIIWRMIPFLFGILGIGAAYVLARGLFADPRAALVTAAVFAVSPIERIYSEQAREYSMLVFFVLLMTIALHRAVRAPSLPNWSFYTLATAAGIYTSPFAAYALAAHAVFVIVLRRPPSRVAILGFCAAATIAIVAYAPWIAIIATHRNEIAATNIWSADHWPLTRLAAKWIFNTGSTFFDLEYINLRWAVVFIPVAIVACVAVVRGFAACNAQTRWFLGACIMVPALILAAPDVLLGEHRSSVARYALPSFALLTIVAARGLVGRPISMSVILGCGVLACSVGTLHPNWWDNDRNGNDAQIAAIVNGEPRAQVVTDIPPGSVITFTRLFNDDVRVSLSGDLTRSRFSRRDPLFVLWPKSSDLRNLEQQTGIAFERVSFKHAVTAHDLGARIGPGGVNDDRTSDLYRAVTRDASAKADAR